MQKATSPKRKSFSLYAVVSAAFVTLGAGGAMLAGISPANAAAATTTPEAQIMVFMIPLTLLVLALMFEVARFALRDTLPAHAPAQRSTDRYWTPGRDEG